MRAKRLLCTGIAVAAMGIAGVAVAVAAGPLKGKTYKGSAASTGVSSTGRHKPFYGSTAIKLTVSGNGKKVSVSFPSTYVIQYCRTNETLYKQETKPAPISANGSFVATVGERFFKAPGEAQYHQIVRGRFSGKTVSGTIHTAVGATPECSGTTTFSAKA